MVSRHAKLHGPLAVHFERIDRSEGSGFDRMMPIRDIREGHHKMVAVGIQNGIGDRVFCHLCDRCELSLVEHGPFHIFPLT
ncbi:MAG: hypothetical protein DWH91_05800 [Planctomycetota bacterium]|nr:MAG: hypothetical protein DWH91_05800 [Planctomycetota bacterium]